MSHILEDEQKGIITFEGASDGKLTTDPVIIKTKEGEVLGTSLITRTLFYSDANKKRQFIQVPLLVKLPDGRQYLSGSYKNPDVQWSNEDIHQKTKDYSTELGGDEGQMVSVILVPDVKSYTSLVPPTGIWEYKLDLIDKYNSSWTQELGSFYETGSPKVGLLFSFDEANK